MRLQAIELDQVGTFSTPVRINDIGPGLNVLAGANELGKSTLLRSLTALFVDQHRTTRQAIRDLRPYAGGAPFIACSFELAGHDWRLEKRYLSAHRALLQRRDGHERHEGADAENRLAELLGDAGNLADGLPLLWVGQGLGTQLPAVTDGVRHALGQLLAAQADHTSGVDHAQTVLRTVEAELDGLVTKTGKARKNSGYHKLLAERAEVRAGLDAARRQTGEAEQRLVRLEELQAIAADLSDREALAAHQAQVGASEKRLREAQDAQRKLQQPDERVAFLESQHTQRQAALAAYDEGLRERADLAAAMEAANITGDSGTLNRQAKSAARSAFESGKQRFFGHLLTSMKTPTLIAAIDADDAQAGTELDIQFHTQLLEMTGSTFVAGMQQVLVDYFRLTHNPETLSSADAQRIIWEHRELANAIRSRDVERARSMIRVHFHTCVN